MKSSQKKNIQKIKKQQNHQYSQGLQNNYYNLKKELASKESPTKKDLYELFKLINIIAMTHAQNLQIQLAFQWLHRSKKHIANDLHLQIVYFNNLGCIYHRNQNYEQSLCELKKAQQIVDMLQTSQQVSAKTKIQTYLNFSAVFSSMKHHIKSLSFIKNALQILQCNNYQNQQYQQLWIAAKHNQAVQYEHLKLVKDALQKYLQLHQHFKKITNKSKYQSMINNTEEVIKKLKNKIKYQNLKLGENCKENILKRLRQKKNCQYFFDVAQIQNAFKQRQTSSTFRTLSIEPNTNSTYQKSARSYKLNLKEKLKEKMLNQVNYRSNQKENKIFFKKKNILNKKRTSSLLPQTFNQSQHHNFVTDKNFCSIQSNTNYCSVKSNSNYCSIKSNIDQCFVNNALNNRVVKSKSNKFGVSIRKSKCSVNQQKQNQNVASSIKTKINKQISQRGANTKILGTIN